MTGRQAAGAADDGRVRADGLGRIAEAIRGCAGGRAAIFMHEDADGDAVGSAMALSLALRAMGVEPSVMYEGRFPAIFDFMGISPDVTSAGGPARGGPGPCGDADGKPYGLGIALDAGDIPRLSLGSEFGKCRVTANIDHHRTNAMFADLNHVDPAMCATGAIVLRLIDSLGLRVGGDSAAFIYMAIATDTGCFKFANTDAEAHMAASRLVSVLGGEKVSRLNRELFDSTSPERLRLTAAAFESVGLHLGGRVASMLLSEGAFARSGAADEDCEGIVNYGRNMRGVEIGILIRHVSEGSVRVNLRSNSYADVALIASRFGGGGHKNAAGCGIEGAGMEGALGMVLDACAEELGRHAE